MRRTCCRLPLSLVMWLALPFASLSTVSFVAADVVVLTTEGRLQGTLLNAQESPRKNYIIQTDSGQVTLDKEQVKEVISQTADELEYERLRFSFPDTVDGQWKIAEWCRERGMSKERTTHLERIVELDPNHKQARAALGYGQFNGRWVRQEDVMKERGYVQYKGRWLLPQDVEIQEQKRKSEIAQKEWFKRLRLVRAQLDDRGPRACGGAQRAPERFGPRRDSGDHRIIQSRAVRISATAVYRGACAHEHGQCRARAWRDRVGKLQRRNAAHVSRPPEKDQKSGVGFTVCSSAQVQGQRHDQSRRGTALGNLATFRPSAR